MSVSDWLFDGLVAVALLWLARGVLTAPDLMKGVVLFIAFGLFMALAWVRLRAPDVALAEAAIGAGLTGALLLDTLRQMGSGTAVPASNGGTSARLLALLVVCPAGALVWAVRLVDRPTPGLGPAVADVIDQSGVSHPVTAVLLNFRGYDTLLEITVLLLAALGVWSLGPLRTLRELRQASSAVTGPIAEAMVRIGIPLTVLAAGYLLWAGGHRPGGGFQAAALLAGGAILTVLTGLLRVPRVTGWWMRLALGCGLLVFLLVGVGCMVAGRFLEFPPAWAKALILLIESALTLSVALTLFVLFLGSSTRRAEDNPSAEVV